MVMAETTLFIFSLSLLGILLLGFAFHQLKLPSMIGYIIAGILIGPHALGLIQSPTITQTIGNFGIILLLFFIGMEISVVDLIKSWRVALFGTLGQIVLSVGAILLIGTLFDWPLGRILLLGFVISLSSTAVLLKLLESRKELNTTRGRNALAILLAQDLAIVPMIIIITLVGGGKTINPIVQILGAIIFITLLFLAFRKKKPISLPFITKKLGRDHELQAFTALIICFGFAALSAVFGLSEALGAFIAGIIVSNIKGTKWIHDSLHSFKTIFVAIFFVSIGMLMDLRFLMENLIPILLILFLVLTTNTLINAVSFRVLGTSWKESMYYGSLLAQIGEFSFLLAAIGLSTGIIGDYVYQLTLSVIASSLVVSPLWIFIFEKLSGHVQEIKRRKEKKLQ